jgi:predicted MFS family arabinose efflux permease
MSAERAEHAQLPAAPVKGTSAFITGLGIAQICSWGSLFYSFPLIAAAMETDLGWSKTELYSGATVGLLLSALAAVPVGAAVDRGYGRHVMTGASIAAGVLLVLWSLIDSLAAFYLVAAAVGALQAATLYDPAFAVVARRAGPAAARNGITAVTLWGGFASTVFVPLIQLLLDQLGWRGTLEVLGAVNILICGGLYFAVIDPDRDLITSAPATSEPQAHPPLWLALRNPVFWGLALAFTAYTATFSAFIFHFYPMMLERGFDAASVVLAMAVIGPAQVVGRIVVSVFAGGMSGRRIGSIVVLAFPVAMGILWLAPPEFWIVAAAAALYGAANGILTIVRGIVIPEMVSREAYGAINGALSVPMVVAKAAAPLAAAWIWSISGDYSAVIAAIVAASIVMTLSFWWTAARSAKHKIRV